MTSHQFALNHHLSGNQPVHGRVKLIDLGVSDVKVSGQGGVPPPPNRGQLGVRANDAGGDHRHHQIPVARTLAADDTCEVKLAKGAHHRLDGAVAEYFDNVEGLIGIDHRLAFECGAHQLNDVIGQMGDVGDGMLLRFAVVVAIAVSDQDGGIGFAVLFRLDDRDMHGGGLASHG